MKGMTGGTMENTLVIIKPDAVERGLVGEIISRFETAGFEIERMAFQRPDEDLIQRFYQEHKESHGPFAELFTILGLGVLEIEELEYGEYGMSPTAGTGIRLKKVSSNAAVFNYVDAGAAKTLVDATQGQMPAATDVRDGVSYASGALTGTCAVPAAGSVALGVPVDATTGTAALTPADVWDTLTSSLTTAGSIGERLKNSASVASTGDQLEAALTAP